MGGQAAHLMGPMPGLDMRKGQATVLTTGRATAIKMGSFPLGGGMGGLKSLLQG